MSFLKIPNRNIRYLGFNDFWFTVIGIILLGFFIPQIFFGVRISTSGKSFPLDFLAATLYSCAYWTTNRFIMIRFRKKYSSFEQAKKRIIFAIITGLICLPITSVITSPIINTVFNFCQFNPRHDPTALQGFGAALTATILIIAIYESIWYYSQLKRSIQEQERVKVAHIHSQLDGLRNQVNPHFLFNSLNTLNHIVELEDKSVAKNFISQLSKVYRYILESREEPTIILEEELEFVGAYIKIQKERFFENLQVDIEIPSKYLHKKIIPLSLQLLVENAIKHNIISSKKPLKIRIFIDEEKNLILINNNLQKKSKVVHSTKVGLDNIKMRYNLLTDKDLVTVNELAGSFEVSLPLL